RLDGLDALRGIAALCVVLFHLPMAYQFDTRLFGKAYLAVDFFFMLSGYVLTRTYHQRFVSGLGTGSFMLARLARLWPTIAVGMVLGFLAVIDELATQRAVTMLASGLVLVPMLSLKVVFPLNVVLWSIFFELFANLIHAQLLWRIGRKVILIIAVALVPIMAWVGIERGSFDVGAQSQWFMTGVPRVLFSYLIGVWLSLSWKDEAPFTLPVPVTLIAMPAAFLLAWTMGITSWIFDLLFIIVACPVLIAGGLSTAQFPKASRVLGDLSFPLYAVHVPIILMTPEFGGTWPVAVLLSLAVAWGTSLLLGPATIRRLRGYLAARRPMAT
ncbi:MAG: acyltransferase, partial [Proteobacteria bacterium]